MIPPVAALSMFVSRQLTQLTPVDILILLLYFAVVLFIGFYVKGSTNTSEEFFLAGREMTRLDRRPELRLRQPGLAGADGLGRLGLPVRHSGHALVLDRRDPRDALPRHRDDAVLLHLEDPLGPRLSAASLRRGRARLSSGKLRVHDHPDVRRQHVRHGRGHADRARLEHHLLHLGRRGHGRGLRHARRPALGHHQ